MKRLSPLAAVLFLVAFAATVLAQGDDAQIGGHPNFVSFEEIEPGLFAGTMFANIYVIDTIEGLVVIDAGLEAVPELFLIELTRFTDKHVHTLIYTHGHVDHVGLAPTLDDRNNRRGFPRMQVVAHENVVQRFNRYKLTHGYNTYINQRQFQNENATFPDQFRYPDVTYSDELKLMIGGKHFHCFHDIGETDDATWVHIEEYDAVAAGDFIIGASPNSGNPQKVQRYTLEWAAALRRMRNLKPSLLLPGHGPVYNGTEIVNEVLSNTIKLQEIIHAQVLKGINEGKTKNQIVHSMVYPQDLLALPYLTPSYDDPEFSVHNIWRQYAGWWDQNPSHLREPEDAAVAVAVCELGGGVYAVATKAEEYVDNGDLRIAAYLIEHASKAAVAEGSLRPLREYVETIRSKIYGIMEGAETSLMGQSIFKAAKADSDAYLES